LGGTLYLSQNDFLWLDVQTHSPILAITQTTEINGDFLFEALTKAMKGLIEFFIKN